MGRGRGRRGSGSRRDGLFLDYGFDLFTQDDDGVLRTPNAEGTFVGAVEDFDLNVLGSIVDFDNNLSPVDNGENPLNESIGSDLNPDSSGDRFTIPTIESLDLTAKVEEIEGIDYITYSLSSPTLTAFGIPRFIFALNVEDEVTLPNEDILDGDISNGDVLDPDLRAISNIEYIIDNELLNLTENDDDGIFVDALIEVEVEVEDLPITDLTDLPITDRQIIESQPDQLSSSFEEIPVEDTTSSVLIEAEDLNLDTYEVEDLQKFGLEGKVISLLDASGHIGTASLLASDFELSGTYDLEFSYFDEADGEAQIEILQNGRVIESIILDDSTIGNVPREGNRRSFAIEDLDIASTDTISIRGIADTSSSGEWARIDNLSFLADTQPEEILTSDQSLT